MPMLRRLGICCTRPERMEVANGFDKNQDEIISKQRSLVVEFAGNCPALVDWRRRLTGRGFQELPLTPCEKIPEGHRGRRAAGNREENVSVDRRCNKEEDH